MFLLSTALIVGRWVSAGRRQSHASLLTSHEKYSWKAMRNTLYLLWEIWCIEMRTNCQCACLDGLGQTFLSPFSWLAEGQNFCQGDFGRGGGRGGGVPKSARMTEAGEAGAKILTFIMTLPYIFDQPGLLYLYFFLYGKVLPILPVKILTYQGSWVCFARKHGW